MRASWGAAALALACAGWLTLAPAHARRAPRHDAPSPEAPTDPAARRAAVREAMEAGDLDRARQLATHGVSASKLTKDKELVALLGELEVRAGRFPEAAKRLAQAAPEDRRSAWLGTLAALAAGDRKRATTLRALAAGTRAGEESLAELGWLLEGTCARPPTTTPEQLDELARAALARGARSEAALALGAAQRLAPESAQVQALLDRLHAMR